MNDITSLPPLDAALAALFADEAKENVVSDHARVTVLRGLEHALLLAPAVAASTGLGATVGAATATAATGSAAMTAGAGGFTAKAVVGIAAVAFGAGSLGTHTLETRVAPRFSERVQNAPIAPATEPTPAATQDAGAESDAGADATPDASPIPLAKVAANTAAPSGISVISTLAAEREVLDVGRAALARGRAKDALEAAKNHAKQFPSGQLVEEREVLAIQALRLQGSKTEASARAAAFVKRYPSSIYASALEEPKE